MPFQEAVFHANMFARELGYELLGEEDLDQIIRKENRRKSSNGSAWKNNNPKNPRLVTLVPPPRFRNLALPLRADQELANKEMTNYSEFLNP